MGSTLSRGALERNVCGRAMLRMTSPMPSCTQILTSRGCGDLTDSAPQPPQDLQKTDPLATGTQRPHEASLGPTDHFKAPRARSHTPSPRRSAAVEGLLSLLLNEPPGSAPSSVAPLRAKRLRRLDAQTLLEPLLQVARLVRHCWRHPTCWPPSSGAQGL